MCCSWKTIRNLSISSWNNNWMKAGTMNRRLNLRFPVRAVSEPLPSRVKLHIIRKMITWAAQRGLYLPMSPHTKIWSWAKTMHMGMPRGMVRFTDVECISKTNLRQLMCKNRRCSINRRTTVIRVRPLGILFTAQPRQSSSSTYHLKGVSSATSTISILTASRSMKSRLLIRADLTKAIGAVMPVWYWVTR